MLCVVTETGDDEVVLSSIKYSGGTHRSGKRSTDVNSKHGIKYCL